MSVEKITSEEPLENSAGTFYQLLGIEVVALSGNETRVSMPVTINHCQPFGYLHGGATISLLETAASLGSVCEAACDEMPLAVHVDVRHRRPGKLGQTITGIAHLVNESPVNAEHPDRRTQYWDVRAEDEDGEVISEGKIEVRILCS